MQSPNRKISHGYHTQLIIQPIRIIQCHPFDQKCDKPFVFYTKEIPNIVSLLQYAPLPMNRIQSHKRLFIFVWLLLLLGTHFNNLNKYIFPLAINYISFFFRIKKNPKKMCNRTREIFEKKRLWQQEKIARKCHAMYQNHLNDDIFHQKITQYLSTFC